MKWWSPICLSEEETLCSALPGTDRSARGDSKCVGSRRQVQKFYLIYFLFPVLFSTPTLSDLHLCLLSHIQPKPDCSLAGALIAGVLQQRDADSCVRMGLLAARQSLVSPHPIALTLTLDSVDPNNVQPQQWAKPRLMHID